MTFVVGNLTVGQVLPEYFGFPLMTMMMMMMMENNYDGNDHHNIK
jgi:hypothetical protein